MAIKKIDYIVTDEYEGKRIDSAVVMLSEKSRSIVRGMFDNDCVSIDGSICNDSGVILQKDSTVSLRFDPETKYKEKKLKSTSKSFKLIFQDRDIVVIDKMPGFLSSPSNGYEKNTILDAVSHFINAGQKRASPALLIHRLDRQTSGVLIFAKNSKAAERIKSQFEDRKPQRKYMAIVAGHLKQQKGTVQSHLLTDKNLNQVSVEAGQGGKIAITHFTTIAVGPGYTVLEVTLETGRRNQIRVHMSDLGHPVLGDDRYSPDIAKSKLWPFKRLALHAATLSIKHPESGEIMNFSSPLPTEFLPFIKQKL
ncbi:MAG: RluA family pseudouridine synthase [Proteobacteria bacterium]|nr:RluA family pseudouridine synthase [Pseudomonadota bacterium]